MEKLGGKRVAVLVGCNYFNTENELQGCINDVVSMKQVLIDRFGFKEDDIELITDEPNSLVMPTGVNIKKALKKMVGRAEEGDVLYFHYSGHGTLIPSLKPNEPRRKDEAIVPCDFNLITDLDFRHLVNRLPPKATFTILSDSCHSGGLIDQEKEQIGPATTTIKGILMSHCRPKVIPFESILEKLKQLTSLDSPNIGTHMKEHFKEDASLSFRQSEGDQDRQAPMRDWGILLSGCQANETSADVNLDADDQEGSGMAHGAFSYAVQKVLEQNSGQLSNKEVVTLARKVLHEQGFKQHPCLYCTDDNANATFLSQP